LIFFISRSCLKPLSPSFALGVIMKSLARSRYFLGVLALAASSFAAPALAADEVNLYTTREPQLIIPLLESFTQDTGIEVNTVFVKDGLIERIKSEGVQSPADVFMTVDIGNLLDLVEADVTQSIDSNALIDVIPAHLRGQNNNWFTLSRSEERRVGKECRH